MSFPSTFYRGGRRARRTTGCFPLIIRHKAHAPFMLLWKKTRAGTQGSRSSCKPTGTSILMECLRNSCHSWHFCAHSRLRAALPCAIGSADRITFISWGENIQQHISGAEVESVNGGTLPRPPLGSNDAFISTPLLALEWVRGVWKTTNLVVDFSGYRLHDLHHLGLGVGDTPFLVILARHRQLPDGRIKFCLRLGDRPLIQALFHITNDTILQPVVDTFKEGKSHWRHDSNVIGRGMRSVYVYLSSKDPLSPIRLYVLTYHKSCLGES